MERIIETIKNFEPFDEEEAVEKEAFLYFINNNKEILTRDNLNGHLTASALVVNEDLTKALLVHHNIFGGYIYPGGHADGIANLLEVAIREVLEETGLEVKPYSEDIFSIHVTPTEAHYKKGNIYQHTFTMMFYSY